MPLYMDFHKIPNITVEKAKKAHVADEAIQRKYGVKYLQFWVNEEAGNLFCLVEGPDKATCESVHKMAHGHVACAIVELDPSYYSLIMGENIRIDQGLVHNSDGEVDLGYRSILAVTLQGKPGKRAINLDYLKVPVKWRDLILRSISKHDGRPIKLTGEDSLLSVFNSTIHAMKCALEIQKLLTQEVRKAKGTKYEFSIGLGTGQPLTENNEFIEETIRLAKRLSELAGDGRILLSSLSYELCEDEVPRRNKNMKWMVAHDETFVTKLFATIEDSLSDESFNIDSLGQAIGISRPQLYRKVRELSGRAPNDLIRDVRLDKALSLLRRKAGKNIAEVGFTVGFNNPSYFAKCFARKFGCQPSQFVAAY